MKIKIKIDLTEMDFIAKKSVFHFRKESPGN